MIAKNELAVADYYVSIDAYIGAIRRANYVIKNIPNSSENYRALKVLEVSYSKLGYSDLLDDVRLLLKANYQNEELKSFPNSFSYTQYNSLQTSELIKVFCLF